MSARQIAIAGAGLVSSIGLNSASTCAALRCRFNNFTELEFNDLDHEPVIGAPVPWLDKGAGIDKLAHMAAAAMRQVLVAHPTTNLADTPLLLCVAEPERTGRMADLERILLDTLEQQLGQPFHPDSKTIPAGQAAVALALNKERIKGSGIKGSG